MNSSPSSSTYIHKPTMSLSPHQQLDQVATMHLHPAMAAPSKLLQALLFLLLLAVSAATQLEESAAAPPGPAPPPSTTPPNLTLHNLCPYTVWPLVTPNSGLPSLLPSDSDADDNSFTHLTNGALLTLPFPHGQAWSGRVVARTGCVSVRITAVGPYASDPDSELFAATRCATGDPPEPVTVAQVSVGGGGDGRLAEYSVSLVDGFNVPLVFSGSGGGGECPTLGCAADLDAVCPEDAKAPGGGCRAEDERVRAMFKRRCPDARTTPTDVEVTPQQCLAPQELRIVFCPDAGGN